MKCKRYSIVVFLAVFFASTTFGATPDAASDFEKHLPAVQYLPKDPLIVWAGDVGMAAESFDKLMAVVRKFLDQTDLALLDEKMKELDEELGFTLRDDLLTHMGPQMAFVSDLLPIDAAAGSIMADVRMIGIAMEVYALDAESYPATDGWVDCAELAGVLEPDYIPEVPAVDGLMNPLRCNSDGAGFRIVSAGKDGEMAMDKSSEFEPQTASNLSADIVFADGDFVISPEGAQTD